MYILCSVITVLLFVFCFVLHSRNLYKKAQWQGVQSHNPGSCLSKFSLMTTRIVPLVLRMWLKLPHFPGKKNNIFYRQQVKRWAVMRGFLFFPWRHPLTLCYLQQQGRDDLSGGVGNISEVTHWFCKLFSFTAVSHQHRRFFLKKRKPPYLSCLKCDIFYNAFRLSHNIQYVISDFFSFILNKKISNLC